MTSLKKLSPITWTRISALLIVCLLISGSNLSGKDLSNEGLTEAEISECAEVVLNYDLMKSSLDMAQARITNLNQYVNFLEWKGMEYETIFKSMKPQKDYSKAYFTGGVISGAVIVLIAVWVSTHMVITVGVK